MHYVTCKYVPLVSLSMPPCTLQLQNASLHLLQQTNKVNDDISHLNQKVNCVVMATATKHLHSIAIANVLWHRPVVIDSAVHCV